MTEEVVKSCEQCGATIYPEHITNGKASLVDGKLLCPVCLGEKKSQTAAGASAIRPAIKAEPKPEPKSEPPKDETLSLVDEKEMDASGRKIESFGSKNASRIIDESKLHRNLQRTGTGATRLKIFHTKMGDGAVDFMCQTVNEWVDANPEVEIKNVQTTVGIWEGKHAEPHLILTVWY